MTTKKERSVQNRRKLNSEILARQLKAFTDKLPPVDHRLVDKFKRQSRA